MPSLEQVGDEFLYRNEGLTQLALPNLTQVGDYFLYNNEGLSELVLPNLTQVGDHFLANNEKLIKVELPNLPELEEDFSDIIDRNIKETQAREKMLANSPAKKKKLGQKKREEREAKIKAYRERLIAKNKKSIGELDKELTELQDKEQRAKDLYNQYEGQLGNQTKEGRDEQ